MTETTKRLTSNVSGDQSSVQNSALPESTRRSLAEWITFILASVILMVLVGFILYDWQINQAQPPSFQVTISDTVRITDHHYYVPFEIQNTGGRIARTVQITAELHMTGDADESGEQQIDFLSGHERKRGSFIFTRDPQQGDLVIRVASYRLP